MKNKKNTITIKNLLDRKSKKPVNVMRRGRNRFPFMDTWAESGKGFGHSRGK